MGEKLIPINTMKINYNNVFKFQITVKINYNNVFTFQNTVFYKTFFINQFTFQFHSSFVRFYIYILIIHFKLSGTMLDVTPWDKRQKVKGFKFCFERFHPRNFTRNKQQNLQWESYEDKYCSTNETQTLLQK